MPKKSSGMELTNKLAFERLQKDFSKAATEKLAAQDIAQHLAESRVRMQKRLEEQNRKMRQILLYCEPYLDQMWAAVVVGILLDCDFKDAKQIVSEWRKNGKET